jgi:hypothetical protein
MACLKGFGHCVPFARVAHTKGATGTFYNVHACQDINQEIFSYELLS